MNKEGLILIVDDDISSTKILRHLFRDIYEIEEAVNGQDALAIIEQKADALSAIILDVYMPVMDGYTVLERISGNEKWKNIPVIVMTSESAVESDQKLFDLGAHQIVHKPINAGIVKKQIHNIVKAYEKHKDFIQISGLERTLIHNTTNTFICVYDFHKKTAELGDNYQNFVSAEFQKVFAQYPFQIENYVLPKNLETARHFFDVEHKTEEYEEIEIRLRVDTVHYKWFKISMLLNNEGNGYRDHAVILFTDIEKEVEAKEKLTFMAMNDMLTHIPNMRTFSIHVRKMLDENPNEKFYMLTMDLYQFNLVNKLFGYGEGDAILKYFATKIQELIEAYDKGVYCRMASDIFYACFSEQEDLQEYLRVLRASLRSYPIKFELRLCAGIYIIEDKSENVENMIDCATYARNEAKRGLLHEEQYYDEHLREKEYFETMVISEMEQALESEQFEVFLQPQYDTFYEKMIGSEALIRWNHPQKGYLSPGIFIPLFEQNGFITELDYYVLKVVCRTIRSWSDRGIEVLPVSVNVSRCDLYDSNLIERILKTVNAYQVPHDMVEFEITESAFISEKELLTEFTVNLRKEGFRVLIDDFGSGYSALNSLKDIQVDVLKIDIKFLPASIKEARASIILKSIIEMAQKLGLDVIAEGVEQKEQVELLETLCCDKVQGFYYARPMPIADYEEKVQSNNREKEHWGNE
ncbi:MAG: REC domain-containing phosphodiesterase [Lachnospiraceae bacterium]|nr:REC domain-containing phosphodiesterase [Lachnospiraceae bacterium]